MRIRKRIDDCEGINLETREIAVCIFFRVLLKARPRPDNVRNERDRVEPSRYLTRDAELQLAEDTSVRGRRGSGVSLRLKRREIMPVQNESQRCST